MPKTIVMIHGMWCGPWCWESFRAFFEDRGYRCLAVTLRHHDVDPDQPPPPELGRTSVLDYAADLEDTVRAVVDDAGGLPVIMGHSMGGLLAQILGARGLAASLVLLAPASPAGVMALTPSVIRCFRRPLTTWGFWRKPHRPNLEEATYSMLHLLSAEERERVWKRLVWESGRAAAEIGFWLFDPHHATRVDEQALTCPTLIVSGLEDHITPPSVTRKVARKYRHVATLRELPRHAHWLIGEPGWEDVAALAAGWLETLSPAGDGSGGTGAQR